MKERFRLSSGKAEIITLHDSRSGRNVGAFFADPKRPGAARAIADHCAASLNRWAAEVEAKTTLVKLPGFTGGGGDYDPAV